jgi:hypothetical protein
VSKSGSESYAIAAVACLVLTLPASMAPAEESLSCAPRLNEAKILQSKDINDIHPDWRPPAYIGLSWSLTSVKREGDFLSGVLVSPRGGSQRGRVYVMASEWDCSNVR